MFMSNLELLPVIVLALEKLHFQLSFRIVFEKDLKSTKSHCILLIAIICAVGFILKLHGGFNTYSVGYERT